ncbi:MAG: hypothetical protein HYZ57_15865 [Acidobacteria bacterium]|nr:hypothetical protein [Acidobacteriota bacterium]MBI3281312.1 hypothetical protein [Acidobacteriota bacterium]
MAIEPVIRKFSSFEEAEQADREYYRSLTPERRLEILLELMESARQNANAPGEGLARVYRIVKLGER